MAGPERREIAKLKWTFKVSVHPIRAVISGPAAIAAATTLVYLLNSIARSGFGAERQPIGVVIPIVVLCGTFFFLGTMTMSVPDVLIEALAATLVVRPMQILAARLELPGSEAPAGSWFRPDWFVVLLVPLVIGYGVRRLFAAGSPRD